MTISKQERSKYYQEIKEEEEEEDYSESEGSDPDYESDTDPSYSILEETHAKFSNLSIKKKSKSCVVKGVDMGTDKNPKEMDMNEPEFDEKSFENAQNIIEAGQIEKLKVEQCKVYLRKHGLRLTGNKDTLIQRIKEHQKILNGGGEEKYPVSSFVMNCKGDACTGDVVMFEQNVYEMFNIASRSASGPPCGTRIVAGCIVKESYGAAKQQHTFTIEVLWSRGEKPLPPLHPLLIKGRNLYRLKTLRQRWKDEGERGKVLMEKHSRGSLARSDRESRIQEKEKGKMLRANRVLQKEVANKNQSHLNSASTVNVKIRPQLSSQPQSNSTSRAKVKIRSQHLGSSVIIGKVESQPQQSIISVDSGKPAMQSQQSGSSVGIGKLASEFQQPGSSIYSVKPAIQPAMRIQQSGLLVDLAKSASGFQQPGSSINYVKPAIHHQQSGEFFDCGKPAFQPQQHKNQIVNAVYNQIPGVWHHKCDKLFYENCRQPDFYVDTHRSPISKRTYHRQPLTIMNHHHPMSPPNRQGKKQQQLCRYYAQGKCHFGDNCKFLHELKEECDQRRGERLHHGHGQRKFERFPY